VSSQSGRADLFPGATVATYGYFGCVCQSVKARLVPPWISTSVVLHREGGSGNAMTSVLARHRLRASILAAGFEVQAVSIWLSLSRMSLAVVVLSGVIVSFSDRG